MFAEALSKSGGSLLEAPITGGLEALKKGQMAVWVAGDKVIQYRWTHAILLLGELSRDEADPGRELQHGAVHRGSRHCHDPQSPLQHAVWAAGKAWIQFNWRPKVCAMAEAMLIAKRSGLDLVEFWHAIRMSAGNSFLWETCGPNVFRGEYHDSFPIDLMNKDTQLGYEMARKAEVRDPS